ncbi:MAG TPA: PIN domain-containing protein [Solirubrobacteraceae bacterium]|nr:PIN domain-containing protein [Solirubrobacteraceae bacterium]
MSRALIDTSVVIALGHSAPLELPDEAAISIVTLCELHHGVLISEERRLPQRLATLALVERRFDVLPADEKIAPHYGRIVAHARRVRNRRLAAADALIAATAAAHDLPLYTLDRDFEGIDGVQVVFAG